MKIYVYRLFDGKGRALYVGASGDVGQRLRHHGSRKWGDRVARVDMTVYHDWPDARVAERDAIRELDPLFNEDLTGVGRTTGHGELRGRVLSALRDHGPLTSVECERAVIAGGFKGSRTSVSAAVTRLRKVGDIRKVGERPAISGRWKTAALYDLSSKPAAAA